MSIEIFPVVHIRGRTTEAIQQAHLALDEQADGVYLTHDDTNGDPAVLIETYNQLRAERPDAFIGLHAQDMQPAGVLSQLEYQALKGKMPALPNAVWADDIKEGPNGQSAGHAWDLKRNSRVLEPVKILGGISHKGTSDADASPEHSAAAVHRYAGILDVVATSLDEHDLPRSIKKIRQMKIAAVAVNRPLAVAGGVFLETMELYGTDIDQMLVASSIETYRDSGLFDLTRLRDTIQTAHKF